ncbi:DNA repair protein RecN [[Clostridium] cellulosi]|jgi:DNA repair protein RecN|uniref:DNA repair protein RecN n=1 Tax=[Clostridium] cellulosi TaxID=29343 RepID=A0A078KNR3_9FIRM|nr:DNA repair protein RecN [[Clostridium] cellulosi]
MLSRLHIENIAVIKNADLDLTKGFNVLTGETGAGKSILIDSINLVLGERVSKDIIRSDSKTAHVSALFTDVSEKALQTLKEFGYDCDDDILIQRDISVDGKGSCRISGRPATVSMVREIGRILVNIHGQHDNQTLLSPEKHITYLDSFASVGDLLEEYKQAYSQMKQIKAELSKIQTNDALKERRIDLLKYQIEEIESANLKKDEEEELKARKLRIVNAEKIASSVGGAYEALCGSDDKPGAQELLSEADSELDNIVDVLPEIKELSQRIKNLTYELEDCTAELRDFVSQEEYDPQEIEYIEERLDTIYRLKRKYGNSIEEIFEFLEKAKSELESIETADERAEILTKELTQAEKKVYSLAEKLSERRKAAARELSERIIKELNFLDMPQVKFSVRIDRLKEPSQNGLDDVEFLISSNPGSPARPLSKIASGGEISRVMLAIKAVLANSDGIDTLIFDEIDTGVSGHAAQKIGNKLKQLSQDCQVICVTHLAQIAAQADRHILIEKQVTDNNTYTHLKTLDYDGRKQELARIIGTKVTEKTLQTADEMLSISGISKVP